MSGSPRSRAGDDEHGRDGSSSLRRFGTNNVPTSWSPPLSKDTSRALPGAAAAALQETDTASRSARVGYEGTIRTRRPASWRAGPLSPGYCRRRTPDLSRPRETRARQHGRMRGRDVRAGGATGNPASPWCSPATEPLGGARNGVVSHACVH